MNQTLAEMTSLLKHPMRAKDGEGQPLPFYNPRPISLCLRMLLCFDFSLPFTLRDSLFNLSSHPCLLPLLTSHGKLQFIIPFNFSHSEHVRLHRYKFALKNPSQ